MMMKTKTFKGANVFMSRNLVPPEIFDTLHDALKHNGAHVFLCCDPSRSAPNDYHIISSPDHVLLCSLSFHFSFFFFFFHFNFSFPCFNSRLQEKFLDLRAKGCNLLGMVFRFTMIAFWEFCLCQYRL